jgi:hypothetical protein
MSRNAKEGAILSHDGPLAVGLMIWQSLVQLSIGKRFFDRYDLECTGYTPMESLKEVLRSGGWFLASVEAKEFQYNGNKVKVRGPRNRVACLVSFKDQALQIVTREPTKAQKRHIEEFGSKMKRVPLLVKSTEDLKARIWA